MGLKVMFIAGYLSGRLNFSQLCAAHSISCKTGYKWVARYHADTLSVYRDLVENPLVQRL
jgi:putative transposase